MTRPAITRGKVPPQGIEDAFHALQCALDRRIAKHGPGAFASRHEAMGVIEEEVRESWEALRSNDPERFREEMFDVAVAALWEIASTQPTPASPAPAKEGRCGTCGSDRVLERRFTAEPCCDAWHDCPTCGSDLPLYDRVVEDGEPSIYSRASIVENEIAPLCPDPFHTPPAKEPRE